MPTYVYLCPKCSSRADACRRIEDRNNGPTCSCGEVMEKIIVPTLKFVDSIGSGYKDIVTGEFVTSKKRRREIMKEHDLVEAG